MIYDIQVLKGSKRDVLKKLGHLLDNREDQDGGLNKEEVYELLKIVNEGEMFKVYNEGYNDGFSELPY